MITYSNFKVSLKLKFEFIYWNWIYVKFYRFERFKEIEVSDTM